MVGGGGTQLDDLDKDEVLKMINQQVEGDAYYSEEEFIDEPSHARDSRFFK